MKNNNNQQNTENTEMSADLKNEFDSIVDTIIEEEKKSASKSLLKNKLILLKDGIIRMRNQKIPYKRIVEVIEQVTEKHGNKLKVSEQTLRSFCQNDLGLPKEKRTKRTEK